MVRRLYELVSQTNPAGGAGDVSEESSWRTDGRPTERSSLSDVLEWSAACGLVSATPANLKELRISADYFDGMIATPIGMIGRPQLEQFCLRLSKLNSPHPLAPNTIRKHVRHVRVILRKAADEEVIPRMPPPPKTSLPKEEAPSGEAIPVDRLAALLDVCGRATLPRLPGLTPGEFWICLLTYLYWTGVRIGHARKLRWEHVDLDGGMIHAPASIQKGHVRKDLAIPAGLVESLDLLASRRSAWEDAAFLLQLDRRQRKEYQTARELVFPWYTTGCRSRGHGDLGPRLLSPQQFYRQFKDLQDWAGVHSTRGGYWGFHAIRRLHGTAVAEVSSEETAAASLGHGVDVFRRHYDCGRAARTRTAVEKLPPIRPAPGFLPGF